MRRREGRRREVKGGEARHAAVTHKTKNNSNNGIHPNASAPRAGVAFARCDVVVRTWRAESVAKKTTRPAKFELANLSTE